MKVKVISLPYIFQVLYVLCFTRSRYQVSVYRTNGPLVINVIYESMSHLLKIQETFPSRLANLVNKLVHAHSFVYLIGNSQEKHPVFLTKGLYLLYDVAF